MAACALVCSSFSSRHPPTSDLERLRLPQLLSVTQVAFILKSVVGNVQLFVCFPIHCCELLSLLDLSRGGKMTAPLCAMIMAFPWMFAVLCQSIVILSIKCWIYLKKKKNCLFLGRSGGGGRWNKTCVERMHTDQACILTYLTSCFFFFQITDSFVTFLAGKFEVEACHEWWLL